MPYGTSSKRPPTALSFPLRCFLSGQCSHHTVFFYGGSAMWPKPLGLQWRESLLGFTNLCTLRPFLLCLSGTGRVGAAVGADAALLFWLLNVTRNTNSVHSTLDLVSIHRCKGISHTYPPLCYISECVCVCGGMRENERIENNITVKSSLTGSGPDVNAELCKLCNWMVCLSSTNWKKEADVTTTITCWRLQCLTF